MSGGYVSTPEQEMGGSSFKQVVIGINIGGSRKEGHNNNSHNDQNDQ